MSTKQDWRERWEAKDVNGYTVTDVAMWSDGSPCRYLWYSANMSGSTCEVENLIPRKPAPVVVPWEPDEVPVGAVVRWKTINSLCGLITQRRDDLFFVEGSRFLSARELFDQFVIHQPGVPTSDCPPCGKVVKS